MDGLKHTAMFVTKSEAMSPKAGSSAEAVIMDNCIRCHTELTTELAMGTNTDMRWLLKVEENAGTAIAMCHTEAQTRWHRPPTPLCQCPKPQCPNGFNE